MLDEGGAVSIEELLRCLKLPRELSHRETEIVAAAVRGLDTKATAAALSLSAKTVDEYWRRVYRKFRCTSRLEVLACLHAGGLRQAEPQPPPPTVALTLATLMRSPR